MLLLLCYDAPSTFCKLALCYFANLIGFLFLAIVQITIAMIKRIQIATKAAGTAAPTTV